MGFLRHMAALCMPVALHARWQLLWNDDFSGPTVNASLWNVLNATSECDPHTSGCNQIELYDADNVYIQEGNLVLRSRLQNVSVNGMLFNVTSGRVDSSFKANITLPARVEVHARLQCDECYGIHTAHWLLGYGCWPETGELDIMEYEIENPGWLRSTSNIHIGPGCGHQFDRNKDGAGHYPSAPVGQNPVNFTRDYHTFAVEWNATDVVYFVNSSVVRAWHVGWDGTWNVTVPTGPMFLILSQAYMSARRQNPPDYAWPVYQYIDYVNVYSWVAGSGVDDEGTEEEGTGDKGSMV